MKGMQWGVATVGGVDGLSEGAKATLNGRWGKGLGPRIREDNGGGRAVAEPALRCKVGDGG